MNMTESSKEDRLWQHDTFVRESLQGVLALIDAALDERSVPMKHDVDRVEKRLAHLRDYLIAGNRTMQPQGRSLALETVNVALSLIVSIGYPGAGIFREGLEEARDLLREYYPPATALTSREENA